MQIVELRISNVKRLRAVTYQPDPGARIVTVSGPNGAGKSSLIDAIAYTLGGAKLICAEPLRTGEMQGYAMVDLGDVVVTRQWSRHPHTGEVTSRLELRARDGTRVSRPQEALDTLLGSLSFDPLAFVREPARRQLDLVRELVGLDFADLDAARATAFGDRTELGRQLRAADQEVLRKPMHAGVPDQPADLQALLAQVEAAAGARGAAERAAQAVANAEATLGRSSRDLLRASEELERAQQKWTAANRECEVHAADVTALREAAQQMYEAAPDPAPLRARLAAAERENQLVRENIDRAALHARARQLHAQVTSLTEEINRIDLEKERLAAAAQLPVPGLGFRFDGLTLNGVPFEQSSQAQQIRVSVAMGAALNPQVRVLLVRDGSLLDRASLELLAELAAERGLQVWLERVGEPGQGESTGEVLVIEDGEAVQAAA